MKNSLTLLLIFFCSIVFAENELIVLKNDGADISSTISLIRKITYPMDSIKIHYNNGKSDSYALTTIRKLVFNKKLNTRITKIDKKDILISFYPNPTSNLLNIRYVNALPQHINIQVVDMSGRLVFSAKTNTLSHTNTIQVDLTDLKSGTYICCIRDNSKSTTQLIVKQ